MITHENIENMLLEMPAELEQIAQKRFVSLAKENKRKHETAYKALVKKLCSFVQKSTKGKGINELAAEEVYRNFIIFVLMDNIIEEAEKDPEKAWSTMEPVFSSIINPPKYGITERGLSPIFGDDVK
ncbi:MAG: hypothetical protein QW035_03935 [Candidatus Anstonellales archaeon]